MLQQIGDQPALAAEWFKPMFDACPQGGRDLEKFNLLLIKDTPAGKTAWRESVVRHVTA